MSPVVASKAWQSHGNELFSKDCRAIARNDK
jgi:hypothetical protein